ncbi:alpha/beta hydrolase [Akkermansiaceae bacterium]|nr:alpha/beta hydrolase [Akkermansiaceae bacterium]
MKTITILSLALLSPLCAKTEKLDLPGARAEIYKKASGDDLYLYIFEPEGHDASEDKRPAAVFFFGGGWSSGTPTQFEQQSRYLAKRGMVAICADYRVASRQKTSPKECVADGKSAIRWVRANAKRLGIDPDRIAAGGGSAGGHVAAAAGMTDGLDDPADENPEVSSKPNALLLFNPVYDNGPDGYGHSRAKKWFPLISPAHNISKDDPPAIVFLGSKDDLIPVATAEKFKAQMEKAGLKSELHVYEGQLHGFFNESKGGTKHFLDTLRKTDEFLAGLGYLEGEPDEAAMKAECKGK